MDFPQFVIFASIDMVQRRRNLEKERMKNIWGSSQVTKRKYKWKARNPKSRLAVNFTLL